LLTISWFGISKIMKTIEALSSLTQETRLLVEFLAEDYCDGQPAVCGLPVAPDKDRKQREGHLK
jgi:hypothetical protein